jgi:NodT family efflux transporter outer membrane factor (OMF) lipoprotein
MRLSAFPLVSLAALALSACATVGPDHVAPATPASAQSAFIGAGHAPVTGDELPGRWWQLYQDTVLDRLIEDALAANQDIGIATANLAAARASLRRARSDRLPSTSIGASAGYGRSPEAARAPGQDAEDWNFDVGFDVAYELDLFGRVRRGVEAARSDVDAAAAARDVVRVAVAAETARAYADFHTAAERLEVARRTVTLLDQTVTLTGRRFEAGRTSRLDVARATALREQQRATLSPLEALRDSARFRLATLTARAPADLPLDTIERGRAPRLDQAIPVGDGRALLARRPDVREAERRLAAATARIGVATADLYPRISFGGSIGATAASLGNLFSGGAVGWLLGPLLSWSFPNQEPVRARIDGAEAEAQAALARFDGAVLRALEETETALSAYAHELEQRQALQSARDQAEIAARISRAQLREGRADFLVVLDADRTLAEAEFELAASDARIVNRQVDLFRALGGGWQDAAATTPVTAALANGQLAKSSGH